jgi:hypothetical protein
MNLLASTGFATFGAPANGREGIVLVDSGADDADEVDDCVA